MTESITKDRINEIDLFRFIAAIGVLLFHYAFRGHAFDGLSVMSYPWLIPVAKYGYLGVQFFFMISGFVIFMTAANATPVSFVRSRIIRLYPAFWACCTITFLVIQIADDPRYTASVSQYLINMTMFSGFFQQPSIDGAYWSIFVEIRFYILIALLLLLRQMKYAEYFMLAWMLYVVSVIFFGEGRLSVHLISDYAPFFIAGASLYLVRKSGVSLLRIVTILGAFSLSLHQVLKQAAVISPIFKSDVSPVVVVVIVSCFFIVMLFSALRKIGAVGRMDWSAIGALTYPLYLLHQFIGYIIFNHFYFMVNIHVLFFGTIILMMLMAFSINRLVERPVSSRLYSLMSKAQPLRS